jgi:hypothetical protein
MDRRPQEVAPSKIDLVEVLPAEPILVLPERFGL